VASRGETTWHLLDLQRNAAGDVWTGDIPYSGDGRVLYLVQALDGAGNTSFMDDAGYEFTTAAGQEVYLPVVIKSEGGGGLPTR